MHFPRNTRSVATLASCLLILTACVSSPTREGKPGGEFERGLAHLGQGQPAVAIEELDGVESAGLAADESSALYFARARAKVQLDDLEGARADLNLALAAVPQNPDAALWLGAIGGGTAAIERLETDVEWHALFAKYLRGEAVSRDLGSLARKTEYEDKNKRKDQLWSRIFFSGLLAQVAGDEWQARSTNLACASNGEGTPVSAWARSSLEYARVRSAQLPPRPLPGLASGMDALELLESTRFEMHNFYQFLGQHFEATAGEDYGLGDDGLPSLYEPEGDTYGIYLDLTHANADRWDYLVWDHQQNKEGDSAQQLERCAATMVLLQDGWRALRYDDVSLERKHAALRLLPALDEADAMYLIETALKYSLKHSDTTRLMLDLIGQKNLRGWSARGYLERLYSEPLVREVIVAHLRIPLKLRAGSRLAEFLSANRQDSRFMEAYQRLVEREGLSIELKPEEAWAGALLRAVQSQQLPPGTTVFVDYENALYSMGRIYLVAHYEPGNGDAVKAAVTTALEAELGKDELAARGW